MSIFSCQNSKFLEISLVARNDSEQATRTDRRTRAAAADSRHPLAHASVLTTSRRDMILMVTTTRALPLSSQSRLHHSPSARHTLLLVFVEDEDSRRLRHVVVDQRHVMHEIDGSEGEDIPPHVKGTRRLFPRPT